MLFTELDGFKRMFDDLLDYPAVVPDMAELEFADQREEFDDEDEGGEGNCSACYCCC